MDCRETRKLLVAFLEDELSGSDKAMVEEHLAGCDACRKEKMLLEKSWSMLDGFTAPEISGDFTRDLMDKIHERDEKKPGFIFVFPKLNIQFGFRELALASVSACVLIAAYLFVQNYLFPKQQIAENISSEEKPVMRTEKDLPAESELNVARNVPAEEERTKVASGEPAKDEKVKIALKDEEIIRNLDVYENSELYQNYTLLNDLDVVENMETEAS